MKNLTLVTTETFGSVPCDFYRSENEILLTREQIGTALEYSHPSIAIGKIHDKHKDRFKNNSLTVLVNGHNVYYYTQRGIMEICRWSRSHKADEFMDWVWDIIETYRNSTLNISSQDNTLLLQKIQLLRQDINELKETNKPALPAPKYSHWKSNTFNKLRSIMDKVNEYSDEELKLNDVMKIIFNEYQDTYDVDLSDYAYQYKHEYGLPDSTKVCDLDIISHYKDLRRTYTLTLDSIMERLHIQTEKYNTKNIFDIIAEKLDSAS